MVLRVCLAYRAQLWCYGAWVRLLRNVCMQYAVLSSAVVLPCGARTGMERAVLCQRMALYYWRMAQY
eukprot:3509023-Rhodomonas_salina.1